ncbi:MAG: site-specific integrase [Synechococcaceae cyanobacterium]|nr:site-specific integrase [Synechococcaceae cyanobacterium]
MDGHNAAASGGLRLELRGARIGLRGPLPCRRGGPGLPVQRLSLGLPASPEGLEQALRRRGEIEQQLRRGRFRWPERSASGPVVVSPRFAAVAAAPTGGLEASLAAFEQAFFADPRRRRRPSGSRSTWTAAYRPYLRRLRRLAAEVPAGGTLSAELLVQVLESYALASRSRQQCAVALAALARHNGLVLPPDWSERGGGYGLHAARFRQLPGDAQILELVERIPNPAWRLVYGLMASYGLRNHEVFFCDLSSLGAGGDRVIRVLPTSKTGEHQVWPFQPDWVEQFGLSCLASDRSALPAVCTDLRRTTLQQVGRRVAEQFRRYGLPITPYDLRHAWAVRTIHIGLPDSVAARMMGHSVAIHTRTYHHWITRRDQQRAVDAALARLEGSAGGHSGSPVAIRV